MLPLDLVHSKTPPSHRMFGAVFKVLFGGLQDHSVDLMALLFNSQTNLYEERLPFIAPYPIPQAHSINIFTQDLANDPVRFANPYLYPPICLIPQVLRFLQGFRIPFTILVPDLRPRQPWWLSSSSAELLAHKGSTGIVLAPSKEGFSSSWPLPWDLWIFRVFEPSTLKIIYPLRIFSFIL